MNNNNKQTANHEPYGSRIALFGIVVYAVVSIGAIDLAQQSVVALCLAMLILLNLRDVPKNFNKSWLLALAVCVTFVLVSVTFLQSLRLPNHPFENSIWKVVRTNIGTVNGAISVAPEQTRANIVGYAPLLVFILILLLYREREATITLLRRLVFFSAAVAIYGIIQHFFLPSQAGFSAKPAGFEGLTAVFVNRNSAGTFFGVGTVLALAFAFYHLRFVDLAKFGDKVLQPYNEQTREYHQLALFGALATVQGVALFLTQSRGAAGATFIAIIFFVVVMGPRAVTARRSTMVTDQLWSRLRLAAGLAVVVCCFALFAGQSTYRQEVEGIDASRLCVYKSVLQAIGDNWLFGYGVGTFSNVFPAYRNAECAGTLGAWDAAHNAYLEGTFEIGIVFPILVALSAAVLIRVFWDGIRLRRRYRFVPAAGAAVFVLVALHALVDFSMQIPGVAVFVASILGACVVVSLERNA